MQRERIHEHQATLTQSAEGELPPDLDEMRTKLNGALEESDRALDAIRSVEAETYLQQNKQRSAQ